MNPILSRLTVALRTPLRKAMTRSSRVRYKKFANIVRFVTD